MRLATAVVAAPWAASAITGKRYAFATIAVADERAVAAPYALGALVIGRALLELGSPHPLLVLLQRGDVGNIEKVRTQCPNCITEEVDLLWRDAGRENPPLWGYAWTKLKLWELEEWDRIVFLDADVLPLQSIDDLFDLQPFAIGRNRGGLCCSHTLHGRYAYSSGMMVLEPSRETLRALEQYDGSSLTEQQRIPQVLTVASRIPDEHNVVSNTALASCGCRPDDPYGTYVRRLKPQAPFQHACVFGNETEYFPGVRDEDVRSVHLHHPKPWYVSKPSDVACGFPFYQSWRKLLARATQGEALTIPAPAQPMALPTTVLAGLELALGDCAWPDPTLWQVHRLLKRLAGDSSLSTAIADAMALEVGRRLAPLALGNLTTAMEACVRAALDAAAPAVEHALKLRPRVAAKAALAVANVQLRLQATGKAHKKTVLQRTILWLVKAGLHRVAERFFRAAPDRFGWVSFWQTPYHMWPMPMASSPVYDPDDMRGGGFIARRTAVLRARWRAFREEYRALLAAAPEVVALAYPSLNFDAGNWTKVMLYDGQMGQHLWHQRTFTFEGEPYPERRLHPRACARMPETCNTLRGMVPGIEDPSLVYFAQDDLEQVNFFSMLPGSRVQWHSAAQNVRLTFHVCLSGCGGTSFIQVGGRRLRWLEGEPIVFDDSYLHRVFIDPALKEPRVVFHLMTLVRFIRS